MRVPLWPRSGWTYPTVIAVLAIAWGGVGQAQEPAVMAPLAAKSLLLDGARAGDRLVVVGERGHILTSIDGGRSWHQAPVPTRAMLTAVAFGDATTGCAVGHDEAIVCSRDGGLSWQLVHWAPEEERPLLTVLFLDPERLLAAGAYGRLLESRDAGSSWQERWISDDDVHLNHLARSETERLYLAAESGVMYRSDDGGETWDELPSPYEGSFFGVLPLAGDALLAFGLRGNLFRSEDAGETWSEIETGTSSLLAHGAVLADGTVVVTGLAGSILVSRDGGRSFALQQTEDRKAVMGVLQGAEGTLIRVGEGGVRTIELAQPTEGGPAAGRRAVREGAGS